MSIPRTSGGRRGRPAVTLTPQSLEDVRQLALAGRSKAEIAQALGIGASTFTRLERQHPALRTIVADAHASIGYQATVETRRARLMQEAKEREEGPIQFTVEVFSTNELDAIYTLARQGLAPHMIPARIAMPMAMWSKLWDSDKRGAAVHAKGVAAAASEVAKNLTEPAKPTESIDSAIPPRTAAQVWGLQWQCSLLVYCDEIEDDEPERADLLGTLACRLCDRDELTQTLYRRLPAMSMGELRAMLAGLEPEADDASELASMLQ